MQSGHVWGGAAGGGGEEGGEVGGAGPQGWPPPLRWSSTSSVRSALDSPELEREYHQHLGELVLIIFRISEFTDYFSQKY